MTLSDNKQKKLDVVLDERTPLSTPQGASAAHNLNDCTSLDDDLFYDGRKDRMILSAGETNIKLPVAQFSETINSSSDAKALPLQPEKRNSPWKKLSKKVLKGDLLLLDESLPLQPEKRISPWKNLSKKVLIGDLLLLDESIVPPLQEPSQLERRLWIRRKVEKAFRKGMNFSLWHCFVAIFIYILISVLAFYVILDNDWTIIDSCYFAVVTFTTIGYVTLLLYI
jgi:hypothetical protein